MSSEDTRKKNQSCVACGKSIDSRDLASMQCGHPFHYQCLQVSLGDLIRKKEYPLCCPVPQCFVEPSMYFMSVVLEEPDFQDYLLLEKNSVQAFETYDCPSCDQSFLAFRTNQTHKCLKCYNTICLECSQLAHPNKPCSPNTGKKQKQQLAQQQQVQPNQPLLAASLSPPPLVLPQSTSVAPQTQLQSSHSRKQSKVQLQSQESTNPYQFQQPQSFQLPQEQQQQYQQIHMQQQQYQQTQKQQHQRELSQTARKPSPRRNSTSTLADTAKNVPLRQLSLKKKEINHTSTAIDRKQTEEIKSNSIGKQTNQAIPKKQQQQQQQPPQQQPLQQQLLQRQYPATVAPSPTAGYFAHKKNSLSQFQAQHEGNNYMRSSKDSNFNPTITNQPSFLPSSTGQMNKTAKTSRKSFDTPVLHASSEDINKILSQTAALLKMQPNLLLPAYNPC